MEPKTLTFVSDEGVIEEAEEGSVFARVLEASPRFSRLYADDEADAHLGEHEADGEQDLSSYSKKQLMEEAGKRGIQVNDKMTKDQVLAALSTSGT